jgi:hypothetical protein
MSSLIDTDQIVQKQLLINVLFTETFLCDLVKEYCFVDKVVYETREYYKTRVCSLIREAICYRRHGYTFVEYWSFRFIPYVYHETLQLEGKNCRFCGDYLDSNTIQSMPLRIQCMCDREQNETEETRLHESRIERENEMYEENFPDTLYPNVTDRRPRRSDFQVHEDDDLFDLNDDYMIPLVEDIDYQEYEEEDSTVGNILDRLVRYETINGYGVQTVRYEERKEEEEDDDEEEEEEDEIDLDNINYRHIPGWCNYM